MENRNNLITFANNKIAHDDENNEYEINRDGLYDNSILVEIPDDDDDEEEIIAYTDLDIASQQIFKEAYQYFSDHCLPPANQDENAVDWWMSAAKDVGELDQKWKDYPLMRSLLLAIYEYMEFKAKEKTREVAEFVQEQ